MDDDVMHRKRAIGLEMLLVGAVVYLVGLWPICHTYIKRKGIFFAAMVMCGFLILTRQEHTGNDHLLFKYLLLLGVSMVAVGIFDLELAGALKILCLVVLGLSMYGTDLYASYSDNG